MKHISTKIIALTLLLVASLILANGGLSLQVLSTESRAYTLQSQQIQTQALAKGFEIEFAKAQEIASRVFNLKVKEEELPGTLKALLNDAKESGAAVKGVGIYFKGDQPHWVETENASFQNELKRDPKWMESLAATHIEPAGQDHIALFPSKNVLIAVKVDLQKLRTDCSGSPIGIYNSNGDPILFCSEAIEKRMKESGEALKEILSSSFKSGTLEKLEGLWGYSDLLSFGKVVAVMDAKTAYRPAYVLGVKIVLLILMSIGIAIVASILVARKLAAPITLVSEATSKIAKGEFDTPIEVKTSDETRILADSVMSMAQKIKGLIASEIEKTKLESQLEVAGAVQRIFIPESLIRFGNYKLASYYKPADQCGGDWWSFVRGKQKLAILVGDVTGHGYASAMLVATTRGCISMIQDQVDRAGEIQMRPKEILRLMNRVVFEATRGEMNMTTVCFVLDLDTGEYKFSSAGHNPSYYVHSETATVRSMNAAGSRLGDSFEMEGDLDEVSGRFEKIGDKIVLFTDGIQDLGSGEQTLGRKGFKKFLQSHSNSTGEKTVDAVIQDLIPMNQGAPLIDDVTFLVIEQEFNAAP
jgi:serine phosphatase RsbU (regulator of sigma subunit)